MPRLFAGLAFFLTLVIFLALVIVVNPDAKTLPADKADAGAQSTPKINLKNLETTPILLDAGDAKRMAVVFNHSSHKGVPCRQCHHEGLPGQRYAACTNPECHAITAASSREPLSVYMAYHAPQTKRSCFGCHKSLRDKYPAFRGCRPCHQSMRGKPLADNQGK